MARTARRRCSWTLASLNRHEGSGRKCLLSDRQGAEDGQVARWCSKRSRPARATFVIHGRGTRHPPDERTLSGRESRGVTGASPNGAACMVTGPGACNGAVPVADRLPGPCSGARMVSLVLPGLAQVWKGSEGGCR